MDVNDVTDYRPATERTYVQAVCRRARRNSRRRRHNNRWGWWREVARSPCHPRRLAVYDVILARRPMDGDDTKYAETTAPPTRPYATTTRATTYVILEHSLPVRLVCISSRVTVSVVRISSVALATGIRFPVVGLSSCKTTYVFKTIRSSVRVWCVRFPSAAVTAAAARSPICVVATRACISGKSYVMSIRA